MLRFGLQGEATSSRSSMSVIEDRVEEGASRVRQSPSISRGIKFSRGESREIIERNASFQNVILENALIHPGLLDSRS